MHISLLLIAKAMEYIESEEQALLQEDMETVEGLSKRRALVLQEVWEQREGCDEDALRKGLIQVHEGQKRLVAHAAVLQQKLREQNTASKKQSKYFSTERHFHAAMRKSNYCDVKS